MFDKKSFIKGAELYNILRQEILQATWYKRLYRQQTLRKDFEMEYAVSVFGDATRYDTPNMSLNMKTKFVDIKQAVGNLIRERIDNSPTVPPDTDLVDLGPEVVFEGSVRIRNLNEILKQMIKGNMSRQQCRQNAGIVYRCINELVTLTNNGDIYYTNERPDGYEISPRMMKLLKAMRVGLLYATNSKNEKYSTSINYHQRTLTRLTGGKTAVFSNGGMLTVENEDLIITKDHWQNWLTNVNLVKLLVIEDFGHQIALDMLLNLIALFQGNESITNINQHRGRGLNYGIGVSQNMLPCYHEQVVVGEFTYGGGSYQTYLLNAALGFLDAWR